MRWPLARLRASLIKDAPYDLDATTFQGCSPLGGSGFLQPFAGRSLDPTSLVQHLLYTFACQMQVTTVTSSTVTDLCVTLAAVTSIVTGCFVTLRSG